METRGRERRQGSLWYARPMRKAALVGASAAAVVLAFSCGSPPASAPVALPRPAPSALSPPDAAAVSVPACACDADEECAGTVCKPKGARVAASIQHACALRAGRVSCWGANAAGQLGD